MINKFLEALFNLLFKIININITLIHLLSTILYFWCLKSWIFGTTNFECKGHIFWLLLYETDNIQLPWHEHEHIVFIYIYQWNNLNKFQFYLFKITLKQSATLFSRYKITLWCLRLDQVIFSPKSIYLLCNSYYIFKRNYTKLRNLSTNARFCIQKLDDSDEK